MPFGIEKVFRRSQPSEGILDKHNATRNVPQWTKTANPEFFPTSCSVSVIEPVISNTIVLGYLLLTIVCVWLSLAPHNFKRRRRGWSVYAVLAVSAVIRMCPLDWTAPSLSSILSYAFSVVPQLCTHELFFGLTSHLLCFLCAQLVFHLHQRLPPTHPDTVFVHMLIWVIPLAINMTSANLNRTFWLLYQTGCNIRTLPTVSQLRYGILRLHELCVLPSTLGQANKTIIHGSLLANLLIFGICLALSNLHRAARVMTAAYKLLRRNPTRCLILCSFSTIAWCLVFGVTCALQLANARRPSHIALVKSILFRPTSHAQTRAIWNDIMGRLEAFRIVQRWDLDYLILERRRAVLACLGGCYADWSTLAWTHKLIVTLPAVVFYGQAYLLPLIQHRRRRQRA